MASVLTVSNNLKKTSSQPCVRLTTCAGHGVLCLSRDAYWDTLRPPRSEQDKWSRKWVERRMDRNTSTSSSLTSLHFLSLRCFIRLDICRPVLHYTAVTDSLMSHQWFTKKKWLTAWWDLVSIRHSFFFCLFFSDKTITFKFVTWNN